MICINPRCGRDVPDEAAFCPWCGKDLREKKKAVKRRGNGQGTVYKRGDRYVAVVTVGYRCDGKRITRSKLFTKKSDAIAALPGMHAQPLADREKITFQAAYDRMMETHAQRIGKKTADGYMYAIRHFGDLLVRQLTEIKTDDLQAAVSACKFGTRTRENMKAAASLTMKWAVQNDIITKNYADYIVIQKEESTEREPFTMDEVRQIYDAVGLVPYADYILCLIFTGFRPNEMFSLKKENCHGAYFIGGSKTAAGKNRIVPIPPVIAPIVARQLESPSEYIFPARDGGKMDLSHFRTRDYYPALDRIGVTSRPPYACRHTYATMLKNIDAPNVDKQRLMGHTSYTMTAHYTHSDIKSLTAITDELNVEKD